MTTKTHQTVKNTLEIMTLAITTKDELGRVTRYLMSLESDGWTYHTVAGDYGTIAFLLSR